MKLAWRIPPQFFRDEETYGKFKNCMLDHKKVVDELILFYFPTHGCYELLPKVAEYAEILARRIIDLKKSGVRSVGINVVGTIGQTDYASDFADTMPFAGLMGHDGATCRDCACPHTSEFTEYTAEKYRLLAASAPDFIWVDDDIRMQYHTPASWPCFCEHSLAKFASVCGKLYMRDELVSLLNSPQGSQLRRQWVAFIDDTFSDLLSEIRKSIHAVNPAIETGLMTGMVDWSMYSKEDYHRWLKSLGAKRLRPGCGFVNDRDMEYMFTKAMHVGYQIGLSCQAADDIQYESENLPNMNYGKSLTTHISEGTLALMMGHNGIAYNISMVQEDFSEYERIMPALEHVRPYWEEIVRLSANLPLTGFWPVLHSLSTANQTVDDGQGWIGRDKTKKIVNTFALARLGLPLSPYNNGLGAILTLAAAETLDADVLEKLLSKPVIMDALSAGALCRRGLGSLVGADCGKPFTSGVREKFTDDRINGSAAGYIRDIMIDCTPGWFGMEITSHTLVPCSNARVLANLESVYGSPLGPCMTAFENNNGGRVLVMGYAPWHLLAYYKKQEQLINAADWLTNGALPLRLHNKTSLTPLVRLSNDRRSGLIMLLNSSIDPVRKAGISLRCPHDVKISILSHDGSKKDAASKIENGEVVVEVESIPAWNIMTFLIEKESK